MNQAEPVFEGADAFLKAGGAPKARAYVLKRIEDAEALRNGELGGVFTCPEVSLYIPAIRVRYNMLSPRPWTVIVPIIGGVMRYRVTSEAQVLAYILARYW